MGEALPLPQALSHQHSAGQQQQREHHPAEGGLAGLAVEPRAAPSAERRAGYSQQQRVENGAVDASGHRHACARDGEDDEVERLVDRTLRSEEHTSELQSLMRTSYA